MVEFYTTLSYGRERPYAMNPSLSYLLPASSWFRGGLPIPPPKSPFLYYGMAAADCGGFVAMKKWGGQYRYTPEQYRAWLDLWVPLWAATMDFPCEPDIAGTPDAVRERQDKTTEMAWYFHRNHAEVQWAWVPTVQGWHVHEYQRHARQLRPLICEMQQRGSAAFRVGIGTLCARKDTSMVRQIVHAVATELPGIPLHLWGVKLDILKSRIGLKQVVSVDSAAWSPGGMKGDGIEARKESISMCLTQQAHELKVALPRYLAKVNRAVDQPKQFILL